ncbi:hypothetical protein GCM10007424_27120 [Flavobacterium suaedae]|uniref:DUF4595 domain-containing protein n=1 Tax=Flavobacterium suaedae TaxID=1767027 RepID=A0ABQ1K605_9FLAO|nr:hypothetical protein [Flavobacterium suaedae]GGB85630.1 hypothetical protein GCM10007424_27120 [Flavobacterium suaedae]
MKIKFLLLVSSLFIISCSTKSNFPQDWAIEELNGKPKKITEFSSYAAHQMQAKKVSYYNESGNLVKTEEYNEYDQTDDSFNLTQITYYNYPENDSIRTFVTYKKNSKDTLNTGTYRVVDSHTIIAKNKFHNSTTLSELEQKLDAENRVIKTTTKVINTKHDLVTMQSSTDFIYSEKGLKKLIIKNKEMKPGGNEITLANKKTDDKGNPVYCEYLDGNKNVVYSLKREYEYY